MPIFPINRNNVVQDFFAGQCLLGIAAPSIPDYRFCWMLNQYLDMQFERRPDMDIPSDIEYKNKFLSDDLFASGVAPSQKERHYFPVYCHLISGSDFSVLLYSNRSAGNRLVQEIRAADYFILFPNNPIIPEFNKINACNHLKGVTWIREIDTTSLISKESLIL